MKEVGLGRDEAEGLEAELKPERKRDGSILWPFGSVGEGEDILEGPADPEERCDSDVEFELLQEDVEMNRRQDATEFRLGQRLERSSWVVLRIELLDDLLQGRLMVPVGLTNLRVSSQGRITRETDGD